MIAEREIRRNKTNIHRQARLPARPSSLRLMLLLLWSFTLFGLLKPSVIGEAAAEGLRFCGTKLIPSLFPLAAAGSILAKVGLGKRSGAVIGRILGWLRISPVSAVCVLMGLFAGFPVGAIIASSLAESGQIDSEEASRLCCFTNNASAAFLVGAVGNGLFGDNRIGWLLWCAQSAAALTVGAIMGYRATKGGAHSSSGGRKALTHSIPLDWGAVSRAIASSALGMLSLAAFVVFFSALTAFIGEGMKALSAQLGFGRAAMLTETAIGGFFEISGGLKRTAALALPKFTKVLLAAAVTGWSGLSVCMQVLASAKCLSEAHVAALPRRLVKAKAASALLASVYAVVLYGVFVR